MDKPLVAYATVLRVLVEHTLSMGIELFQWNHVKLPYRTRVQCNSVGGPRGRSQTQLSLVVEWQPVPPWLLSISYLPPLLLALELETSSSHQRIEKPQSPANHFWVVQTLRQLNLNRHLRNNYFLEFREQFGPFELPLSSPAISLSLIDAYLALGTVWK